MRTMRIALGIEYCGTHYHGWQKQDDPRLITIQGLVEQAVSAVANESIEVVCSGRTDRGVHALEQVVHFETQTFRENETWVKGINHYLPSDIRVRWAFSRSDQFHARYSAYRRRYQYWIDNRRDSASAFLQGRATWIYHPLSETRMHDAGQYLLGEHDFSAFRAVGCQSKSVHRRVDYFAVQRSGDLIMIDIAANAFLYHMVRNIVGSLILIGREEQPVLWLKTLLESGDRTLAGPTAEAAGLYFLGPEYDMMKEEAQKKRGEV